MIYKLWIQHTIYFARSVNCFQFLSIFSKMSEHFVFVSADDDNMTMDMDDSANESSDEVPTEETPDEFGGNSAAPNASQIPQDEQEQEQMVNK